ncbi:MAG: hypothetical protein C5B49_14220 [Bdellovibrio sp.]|nr:MAG: hypothetical protein C5B49_14220 [Bdellovibrio sp.]
MLPRQSFLEKLREVIHPIHPETSLSRLMATFPHGRALDADLYWFEELLRWLARENYPGTRLNLFLDFLDHREAEKKQVAELLRHILVEASVTYFLANAGFVEHITFLREAVQRVWSLVLPRAPVDGDLTPVLTDVFNTEDAVEWLERIPLPVLCRLEAFLRYKIDPALDLTAHVRQDSREALAFLGTMVASIAIHPDLRSRMDTRTIIESPFLKLNVYLQYLAHQGFADPSLPDWKVTLAECQTALERVHEHLEDSGVSVDIVFKIDVVQQALWRIDRLLHLWRAEEGEARTQGIRFFTSSLLRSALEARTLSGYFRKNAQLLARKVVERTGDSGDRYIVRNREEYMAMLQAAAGGGIVTLFTTILKMVVIRLHLPLFFEGFFIWINYAGSFILMQFAHFSLATKLSAMTASALASRLQDLNEVGGRKNFVDEVAALARTQFAAVIGNVGAVSVVTVLFVFLFHLLSPTPSMDPQYAHKIIDGFQPWKNLLLLFACLTGVILWISGLISGWFENWIVFHRIPVALAKSRRLGRVFGVHACQMMGYWLLKNSAGLASNLSLSFMLAFVPVFGTFFGLRLEVPHVTLMSGATSMALCVLPWDWSQFAWVVVGIASIGAMNIGVSFFLTVLVAARARGLASRGTARLFFFVLEEFRRDPRKFFWPASKSSG